VLVVGTDGWVLWEVVEVGVKRVRNLLRSRARVTGCE
jgi:hypothetical protein